MLPYQTNVKHKSDNMSTFLNLTNYTNMDSIKNLICVKAATVGTIMLQPLCPPRIMSLQIQASGLQPMTKRFIIHQ